MDQNNEEPPQSGPFVHRVSAYKDSNSIPQERDTPGGIGANSILRFDLPRGAKAGARKHIFGMDLAEFHQKWHVGTPHARTKKGRKDLSKLEDRLYTAQELGETVGYNSPRQTIALLCRTAGLPHYRGADGRILLVNGLEFAEWYRNPPEVCYPLKHRLSEMNLRCVPDTQSKEIAHTYVLDVWRCEQEKEVYQITLKNGKQLVTTKRPTLPHRPRVDFLCGSHRCSPELRGPRLLGQRQREVRHEWQPRLQRQRLAD